MNRLGISSEFKALRYDLVRAKKRTYRKNRKNSPLKAVIVLGFVMLILLSTFALFSANAFGSAEAPEPLRIMVREGDSLWSIATEYAQDRDIRMVIYEIRKCNQLETSDLYPGMELLIPELA